MSIWYRACIAGVLLLWPAVSPATITAVLENPGQGGSVSGCNQEYARELGALVERKWQPSLKLKHCCNTLTSGCQIVSCDSGNHLSSSSIVATDVAVQNAGTSIVVATISQAQASLQHNAPGLFILNRVIVATIPQAQASLQLALPSATATCHAGCGNHPSSSSIIATCLRALPHLRKPSEWQPSLKLKHHCNIGPV